MADVFLSYAREDARRVAPIVDVLRAAGWSVFWDQAIPPGSTWRQHLGGELAAAGCVLVVWSEASARSDWVADEADEARRRGVMLPVMLDAGEPPLGFRGVQALDLSGADLSAGSALRERLVAAVAAKLATASRPPPPPPPPPPPGPSRWIGLGVAAVLTLLLAYLLRPAGSPPSADLPAAATGQAPPASTAMGPRDPAVAPVVPARSPPASTPTPASAPPTPPRQSQPAPSPQLRPAPPQPASTAPAPAAPRREARREDRRAQFEAFAFAPDGLNLDRAEAARWADARMAESPPLDPGHLRRIFALAYRPDLLNLSRAEAADWALARLRERPQFDVVRFEALFRQGFDRGGRNLSREEAARWALAQMRAPP